MRHFVSARLARIPLLRPNALPRVTRRTLTSTSSTPASPRNIGLALGVTAIATASYLLGQANIVQAHAEQNQGPLVAAAQAAEQKRYASPEEVQKVIDLLRKGLKPDQVRLREDQVSTNPDDRLVHGSSPNTYHAPALPDVVVYAETTEDVSFVMKLANAHAIPVVPYSGGTSLEGHITCPYGGICVDLSRMNRVLEVHEQDSDAIVQAGAQWEAINEELRDRGLALFFPLDPGPSACIGGMMATGCSGTNAVRYGTAKGEWFLNATVVLPSGEIIKTRQRSRKSSAGYDLTKLFIGAEGTLGIVTEATIKLAPVLPTRVAVCGFPGVEEAVQAVGEVINRGVQMQCVELCDTLMMSAIKKFGNVSMPLPDGLDSIFFKFQGADEEAIQLNVRLVTEIAKKYGGKDLVFAEDDAQSAELWSARKAAHWSAMALVPGGTAYSTDVCVPVGNLPRLVKETKEDLAKHGIVGPILGHVGDGNFHSALIFDPKIPGEFEKVDAAAHRMVERAIALDGTCTGEHGVGIGKKIYLRSELGDGTLNVMRTVKNALDPKGIMNPGKVSDQNY
ncbi:FAD-linked oxidase-like protein [Papiliotrema laurentii]|uniref:D-lactate dehydrogenase (cytochrome) n=1 Tax=Papiliotrema laurentii TaxID=5418 RepID=A0AAD9L9J0_PAPLA|nr:FAD-linked oxidase-like protein [Papiliotrema laurentii]